MNGIGLIEFVSDPSSLAFNYLSIRKQQLHQIRSRGKGPKSEKFADLTYLQSISTWLVGMILVLSFRF